MSTKCRHCDGTGKMRTIAVVGEPDAKDQMSARDKIQSAVHPGDHVVCFSDFAQMVCADGTQSHSRERDKKLDELENVDEVVDIGSTAERKEPAVSVTPGSKNPPPEGMTPGSKTPPPEGMTPGTQAGGPPPHVPGDDEPAKRRSLFSGKKHE